MTILRRSRDDHELSITRGGLTCFRSGEIICGNVQVRIPRRTAEVLFRLMCVNRAVPKEEIADWLYVERLDAGPMAGSIRSAIGALRTVLARHRLPIIISTRYIFGYQFNDISDYAPGMLLPSSYVHRAPNAAQTIEAVA